MSSTDSIFRPKKLLILGATGLIGSQISRCIIEGQKNFEEIAIFTSPGTVESKGSKIQALKDQGVRIIVGNLENEEDVKNAYQGVDTVISCVGRNMISCQTTLIRLAAASSTVKWFFPSEYGTDIEYNSDSAHEVPHQAKLKVRATMATVTDSLNYTYLVTGPYGDGDAGLYLSSNLGATRTGSFDVKSKTAVLLGDGHLRIGLTTMKDVGKLVLAALLHPEKTQNRAIKVNSFFTTDAEILAEFEKQTGGQPWKVTYTPLDELRRLEQEAWSSGNTLATLITLRRIWAEGGTLYEKMDNQDIGITAGNLTSLSEAVADAIQMQLMASQEVARKLV